MLDFELFRVKVFALDQRSLFANTQFSPQLALVATINKTPSIEIRKGYTWHIGNVQTIDDFGMYFALGRTTKTTRSMYDEGARRFVEMDEESAPFTHVVCDTAREVCGIARQRELAPTAASIARQFEALLNSSVTADASTGYRFELSAIRDPADFLEQIRTAYAVTRFAVTFSLPNAFDIDQDIQGPVEHYAKEVHAKKGTLQVTGPALDKGVIEAVARSGAASGNDVKASIRTSRHARPVQRSIKGDPAAVKESEDVASDQQKRSVLGSIRELYGRIRRGDGS